MNDLLFDLVVKQLKYGVLKACHIDASVYTCGQHTIMIEGTSGFIRIDDFTIGQMTTEQQDQIAPIQAKLYMDMENNFIKEFTESDEKIKSHIDAYNTTHPK